MNLQDLQKPLPIESIDFRIQSINKGGYATILAYKDARVDMNRLDDVCGPLNWKREHSRENQNCTVSIWCNEKKQWISKEDTGTESFTEKEKGLASDSFKRACFNWGIGRELYDYPVIQIKLNSDEFTVENDKVKQSFKLNLRKWKWSSVWVEGNLKSLICTDETGKVRFEFGKKQPEQKQTTPERNQLFELDETEIIGLKNALNQCKSQEDLKKIWTANPELKKNTTFIKLVTDRKKVLIDNGIE